MFSSRCASIVINCTNKNDEGDMERIIAIDFDGTIVENNFPK